MRAVTFSRFGGPEVLQVTEVADPVPGVGEVVIQTEAAGVCHHDLFHRSGRLTGGSTQILGHEVAGTVLATGAGTSLPIGTRVVAYNRLTCGRCRGCLTGRHDLCSDSRLLGNGAPGGYAEFVAIPEIAAIQVPAWIESSYAALATCPIGTSVRALCGVAGVRPGDNVVVTGASGGLGIHQIQIAHALGARPIAVTRSTTKEAALTALGAEVIVSGSSQKLRHTIRDLVGERGVDIVIENITSATLPETVWTVRPGGVIVVLGNIDLSPTTLNPGLLIERRLSLIGSGNPTYEDVRRGLSMIEHGMIRPQIHTVLPFAKADIAHGLAADGATVGRVVLSGW